MDHERDSDRRSDEDVSDAAAGAPDPHDDGPDSPGGAADRLDGATDRPDGPPDLVAARDHVISELVRFARALRRAGVDVPANAAIDAARVLVELGVDDRAGARAGLAAVLLGRRSDRAAFAQLFPEFWRRLRSGLVAQADPGGGDSSHAQDRPVASPIPLGADAPDDANAITRDVDRDGGGWTVGATDTGTNDTENAGGEDEHVAMAAYSPVGRPTTVGARDATMGIDDGLSSAIDAILGTLGGRLSRRFTRSDSGAVDVRRALRRSFGTGGTVLEVPERARRRNAVETTVLVDVSQSVLDALDRPFLLAFLREVSARSRGARVFFFDTNLREVTDQIDASSVDAALAALERAETTWGGGTRIGHAVGTIREEYPDAVDRTTTVFVVSDGLERGDVDALESGMAWLSDRADAVLWLNPLATSPRYEPACRGMAVSLPYVDGLFAFAGPDDVAEIARQLELYWPGDGVGYEHDPRRRDRRGPWSGR
jgi:uncharacterized protein with von Willebrand factor type A (vWA) domain